MAQKVKIQFSPEELRCINDTDFLLRKRVITDKLYKILHEFTETLKASAIHKKFKFPVHTDFHAGKISRGENYKGLPYVILDYPRLFEKENVFAFRTIFWWGNYFSFTLHLKGKSLEHFRKSILENLTMVKTGDILIYAGDNEWEHDLSDRHYLKLDKKAENFLKQKNFIKLSRKMELSEYQSFFEKGLE